MAHLRARKNNIIVGIRNGPAKYRPGLVVGMKKALREKCIRDDICRKVVESKKTIVKLWDGDKNK